MNPNIQFYEPSEQAKPIGLLAAYGIGLLLTTILSYCYTLLIQFIPLIYFNVIITVGFGLVLGLMVRLFTRLTHNRSLRHQLFLAIALGLWANYCQWVGFVLFAIIGALPPMGDYLINLGIIAEPSTFFGVIGEINKVGMWEIFGITFNGWLLALIWLIEAGIIAALPVIAVFNAKSIPYAEDLQSWYPRYELDYDFEVVISTDRFIEDLQKNALAALKVLGPGKAWKHAKIHLHYLPEASHQYLSVEKVYIADRGQGSKETEHQISNFQIDRQAAKSILDAFPHTKHRWEW